MKNLHWIIQTIMTIVILLFGFNYTNGKNNQIIEDNIIKIQKCENNIDELKEIIHKLDKSIERLTIQIEYLRKGK